MRKSLRWLSLFMAPALVISLSALMVACSSDDDGDDETAAVLTGANPADGSSVPEGSVATLTFDKDPGAVTVNGTPAEGAGAARTFTVTAAANSIAWDLGGSATVNYTLTAPDTDPAVLDGTDPDVDGKTDVDPADLADGLALNFNEPILDADIELATGGSALAWVTTGGEDGTITLAANPDDPIVNETEYTVTGEVTDAGENEIGRAHV